MARAKRARDASNFNFSRGGKRAKNVKDHYNTISQKGHFIFVIIVLLLLISAIAGTAIVKSIQKLNQLTEQKDVLQEQKEGLSMTSERLREEVEFTNTKEFIQYMARKLLGWINPNETKYIIID